MYTHFRLWQKVHYGISLGVVSGIMGIVVCGRQNRLHSVACLRCAHTASVGVVVGWSDGISLDMVLWS